MSETDQKKAKKSSSQKGFAIAMVVLSIIVVPYMYYAFSMYFKARALRPDYDWPSLSELWKAAVSGVVFLMLKSFVIEHTFAFNTTICKNQDDPEMLHLRAKKASKYVFQFCYFVFATTYGYYTLKDAVWLPWFLGGNGTWEAMWADAPYTAVCPGATSYAMLQLGYHFGDLIHLYFIEERQNDYAEMMTHHIATSSLLVSMIFANQMSIGCVVAFQHDIADITVAACKYLSQTKYTMVGLSTFIVNMVVWAYTRNILLAYVVYRIWTEQCDMYKAPFEGYSPII
jgi:hypothetical protein